MKRYYKKETQLESLRIYWEAVHNSTPLRLRARALRQRELDIEAGKRAQRQASWNGARARMLWATKNQNRLIRVFV